MHILILLYITCILLHVTDISLAIVQRSLNICSFFPLFFFSAFRLNNFYYSISKFTGSFFHPLHSARVQNTHSLFQILLHFSVLDFFSPYKFLQRFPSFLLIVTIFSFVSLSIVITVLKQLSANFNTGIILERNPFS